MGAWVDKAGGFEAHVGRAAGGFKGSFLKARKAIKAMNSRVDCGKIALEKNQRMFSQGRRTYLILSLLAEPQLLA